MIFPIIGLKANDNRVKKEVGETGPVKAKNEKTAEAIGATKTLTRIVRKPT
ncbi:MAG: hypothetical protein A4E71_02009 [Smithella sp. PtaU1.Bin162]|jgi:hypothetical protein|nr:MAG: hypothetical protein A4E71_02009 [Smithella sp. PtaU1.Bin162]